MLKGPYPGGYEEECVNQNKNPTQTGRTTVNTLVTTMKRDSTAIRTEIIQSSINYLDHRLSVEQEVVKCMQAIAQADSVEEFLEGGKALFSSMPLSFDKRKFTNEIIEDFDILMPPNVIAKNDYSVRIFHMLKYRAEVR